VHSANVPGTAEDHKHTELLITAVHSLVLEFCGSILPQTLRGLFAMLSVVLLGARPTANMLQASCRLQSYINKIYATYNQRSSIATPHA
jgi:hypothetical protein